MRYVQGELDDITVTRRAPERLDIHAEFASVLSDDLEAAKLGSVGPEAAHALVCGKFRTEGNVDEGRTSLSECILGIECRVGEGLALVTANEVERYRW